MAQKQPIYHIGTYNSSSLHTDTQLNVHASNKRFRIDLFTSNFESSPALQAEYLRHVRRQEPKWTPDEFEEVEDPLVEMHDWILQPFLPIFRALALLDPSQKIHRRGLFFCRRTPLHCAGDGWQLSSCLSQQHQKHAESSHESLFTIFCRLLEFSCLPS